MQLDCSRGNSSVIDFDVIDSDSDSEDVEIRVYWKAGAEQQPTQSRSKT